MMNLKRIFLLAMLILLSTKIFSIAPDTLFIRDLKNFIYKQANHELSRPFFSKKAELNRPYIYLYVSENDKVKRPAELNKYFSFYNFDISEAKTDELKYKGKGYHTFIYATNGNSNATINDEFLGYQKEAQAFIVFHEYVHNYIAENKIKIFYEYTEAICDVVGNYMTMSFFKNTSLSKASKKQMKNNEYIYSKINYAIADINRDGHLKMKLERLLTRRLKRCNDFQKDRFECEINNAFLLKNLYYSENYFLIRKVFKRQKGVLEFLEIIRALPDNIRDYEAYLRRFI